MPQDLAGDGVPTPGDLRAVPVPGPGRAAAQDATREDAIPHDAAHETDAAVTEALGRLAELKGAPLREHVAIFDAVHGALQDRLAETED